MSSILVTGGTGYIGSHTVLELLSNGYDVVVLDNLSNASAASLQRVAALVGKEPTFIKGDVCDVDILTAIFSEYAIDAVIHFAGLKAVGESVSQPLSYYLNNVSGTLTLCQVMAKFNCKTLVFSSSATVYGDPDTVPITEAFPLSATNPYGRTKLMIEQILADLYHASPDWNIARLRYFNPVGAHPSGQIGEDPSGIPNNLMPYIAQVAIGKRQKLSVFGGDYDTPDGTGVRDYIHVVDLAKGHLAALDKLKTRPGLVTYNLGTGKGYSVLNMVNAFEAACGYPIAHEIVARRPGDIACCYADPSLAEQELGWTAKLSLNDMARDTWRWQQQNPDGYSHN